MPIFVAEAAVGVSSPAIAADQRRREAPSLAACAVVGSPKKPPMSGGRSMRGLAMAVGAWIVALALPPQGAWAQQAGGDPLNDQQLLGMRLFNQSCRVCHTKPQMTSPLYGPELSQNSSGGQEAVMREVISNGTPRMPGFKYHFEPAQIEAIVAYLKTIPIPPAPASPAR